MLLDLLTQARGGSGSFQWSCDHVDVVGVSLVGVATAIGPGKAIITASDTKSSAHFDTAEVQICVLRLCMQCTMTLPLAICRLSDGLIAQAILIAQQITKSVDRLLRQICQQIGYRLPG